MALIEKFMPAPKDNNRVHEGVECGWTRFERKGRVYIQLDTYGSMSRKVPGKVSQSIQLDRDGAIELLRLLRQTFPGV